MPPSVVAELLVEPLRVGVVWLAHNLTLTLTLTLTLALALALTLALALALAPTLALALALTLPLALSLTRYVLHFSVWHPGLTPTEVHGITAVHDALRAYEEERLTVPT